MFPNPITPLVALVDAAASAAGWTFDKVIEGVYRWLANALALLVEWVWQVLDRASRPHVLEPWFATGLVARLAPLSLAVIVAMMLVNAISAGFTGRPELVGDTIREAAAALFSTAIALTVIDALLQLTQDASGFVWQLGRDDLRRALEGWLKVASQTSLGQTFIGPLCVLLGIVGLLVTTVVLFMRSTLIYVIAALYPLVRASAVAPMFRASTRKLTHVTVSLILAPFAVTLTLVVAVKLLANNGVDPVAGAGDQVAAIGTMLSGFIAFLVAGLSPWVLYKVMPTIESAAVGAGIASGWGRSGMSVGSAAMMVKTAGASKAMSAATRPVAGATAAAPGPSGSDPQAGRHGGVGGGAASRPTPGSSQVVDAPAVTVEPAAGRSPGPRSRAAADASAEQAAAAEGGG